MSKSFIQIYIDQLLERARNLPEGELSSLELAQHLNLSVFQINGLVFEGHLPNEKDGKFKQETLNSLRSDPWDLLRLLPLTINEIESVSHLPRPLLSELVSKRKLKAYGKRRRKGQLKGFFHLEHCLHQEDLLERMRLNWEKNRKSSYEDAEEKLDSLTTLAARREHDPAYQKETAPNTIGLEKKEAASEVHQPSEEALSQDMEKVEELGVQEFKLDDWQQGAIKALEEGKHVFVQAPTGAGKTKVVEEFLTRNIESGIRLFYAVPIKALANDKFFDFCDLYGRSKVGINTGDITINPDAPIVVGTTEIVRNILFGNEKAYDYIAFDEAQYLGDDERGGAWEESIILASPKTGLIFLSGSVANAQSIMGWVKKIKQTEVELFIETLRPVPLHFAFPYQHGFLGQKDWSLLKSYSSRTGKTFYPDYPEFFDAAKKANMTPMLVFMPRRRDCESVFDQLPRTDSARREKLKKLLASHPEGYSVNSYLRRMVLEKGCAYHHSGLLPAEKRVIESLAKKGDLDFVSATMSLAAGVNFSVRSCLISQYRRPGKGGSIQNLSPSEILQMWGRAGRRGLDKEGYVIPFIDIQEMDFFKKVEAYPEPIERRDFVSATNILSVLARYDAKALADICKKSLSSFLHDKEYRLFYDQGMIEDAGSICQAPTFELSHYRQGVYANQSKKELEKNFRCGSCPNLESCTVTYEKIKINPLQRLVKHLRLNEFISADFSLTHKGRLAERFHNEIGLLLAHDMVEGLVTPHNLVHYAASISAPAHIRFSPAANRGAELGIVRKIYPQRFFPNLWELFRGKPKFIYWNPGAGDVALRWMRSANWESFVSKSGFEDNQGDVFRMILRTGELLRSMSHIRDLDPEMAETADEAVRVLLRPPLVPESLFEFDE